MRYTPYIHRVCVRVWGINEIQVMYPTNLWGKWSHLWHQSQVLWHCSFTMTGDCFPFTYFSFILLFPSHFHAVPFLFILIFLSSFFLFYFPFLLSLCLFWNIPTFAPHFQKHHAELSHRWRCSALFWVWTYLKNPLPIKGQEFSPWDYA